MRKIQVVTELLVVACTMLATYGQVCGDVDGTVTARVSEQSALPSELREFAPPFRMVNFSPGPEYSDAHRKRQGEPTIERAPGGRLWAAWSPSPVHEDRYRYIIAATSGNDGETWDIVYVIDDRDGPWQITDHCMWLDPDKRLWHFWWQTMSEGPVPSPGVDPSGKQRFAGWQAGVPSFAMAMTTEYGDCERPVWSEPRPIARGVPINKPIVTRAGEWILPTAMWPSDNSILINVSRDKGRTWTLRGTANVPKNRRSADEPMIVERNDGSLWMLVRTTYGIGQTVSRDGGRTWSEVEDYLRNSPARFHLRRLSSDNLLLVKYHGVDEHGAHSHLTAYLSDDDGKTWKGGLLLDARLDISYPDGVQAPDGRIYVIHDYERWDEKKILMHVFTEEDVLAHRFQSPESRQNVLINQATGVNLRHARAYTGFRQRGLARAAHIGEHERRPPRRVDPNAASFRFGPRAAFVAEQGEIRRLIDTAQIFSNRPWQVQELPRRDVWDPFHPSSWPPQFSGFGGNMEFVFSPYERTVATCIRGGMAYVFTPTPDRSKESVERDLLSQGFEKTSELEFYFFVPPPVNEPSPGQATTVYQKEVKPGERIEFGEWGCLVF